ncbi:hypothetical protein BSL78_19360 [Apostichopus japonicus]|uniref:Uncharacterized protein n=1 Tax=Stichopus japonicus TaxID=307972 RepID=A0A2G8K759_STIJA|nr:hypothetical protein BSL78_19360 [Apostichopus japonicus]
MVHYPNCIRMCGPLTSMQCLKYEMKHAFSKKLAAINCNFKNICKSAACKHQIWQCIVWSGNEHMLDFECQGGSMTAIESLDGNDAIADKLQCNENSDVFVASQVSLYGTEYKANLYLILAVDDASQLKFGKISSILVCGQTPDDVYFVVSQCQNIGFNTHYHAYEVAMQDQPVFSIVTLDSLTDHLPLSGLRSYEENSPIYLCPRYSLTHQTSTVSSIDDSFDTLDDDVCLEKSVSQPTTSTLVRCIPPPTSQNIKSSSSSNSVLTFNLKKVMEDHSEGGIVDDHLTKGGIPSSKQRRTLVRLAVACMVDKYGLYPSSKQKMALAKEIVKTYPSTMDTTPGLEGHVNWMKYMPPTHENHAKHRQYLKDTFNFRRAIIEGPSSLTITDIVNQYPRFQDMPELINLEFQMMYPERCDNFITKWETCFREKIIALGEAQYPAVQGLIKNYKDGNRDICALSVLTYMLHRSVNLTKGKSGKTSSSSRADAMQYLIQNVPEGTDVEEATKLKEDRFKQPLLLSLGAEKDPKQFFVILDRIAISGGLHVVDALDRLFKCHYVFNVEYSPSLQQFWEFIAAMNYEVLPPATAKPQVRALGAAIRAPPK